MWTAAILYTFISFVTSQKVSYAKYNVYTIKPKSNSQLEILDDLRNKHGYEFWRYPNAKRSADLMVAPYRSREFIELMRKVNMEYYVIIENVQNLIEEESRTKRDVTYKFGWRRYHTIDEIYEWLDSLKEKNKTVVEVIVGGKTYQNREIRGVKLTFAPNRPGVFIEGGIHAREWISPATVTYLINELLTSHDKDVRKLAESYTWYMFPCFNPDGYVYTHEVDRLWRKTLSQNGLCVGVDANRNWGYLWSNTSAAHDDPCKEDYRGASAFSEIETQTLSHYIQSIHSGGNTLHAYISLHSYSQVLILPYGYTGDHISDYDQLYAVGVNATTAIYQKYGTRYRVGNTKETLGYTIYGSSMDWAKGSLGIPIVYSYEMRPIENPFSHGFILPPRQIISNGREILHSLVVILAESATNLILNSTDNVKNIEKSGNFTNALAGIITDNLIDNISNNSLPDI